MLQIAVNDNRTVAFGLLQSGEHGGFLAEVSGEAEAFYFRIGCARLADFLPGVIPGTIIDKKNLIIDLLRFQKSGDHLRRLWDHFFFVIGRYDY